MIYHDTAKVIQSLTDEQAGQLFKVITHYADTGETLEMAPIVEVAFHPFKLSIDRGEQQYQVIVDRNRENGKKGGRPKKAENPEKPKKPSGLNNNPKNPDGFSKNPEKPKKANSNYNSNSNSNSNNKNTSITTAEDRDLQEIIQHYNAVFDANVTSTKPFKKNYLYWRDVYSVEQIKQAITNARADKFWSDKLTLVILFRTKSPDGEQVDRIGNLERRNNRRGNIAIV